MKSSQDTTLRIDSLQWPVTVLGYGARIGIWFQGCSIGCPGCCAKHTWNADEGKSVALTDLLAWIRRLPLDEVNGVTITGGEPFEQPEALHRLVVALRRSVDFRQDIDILCYSGFPWKRLSRQHGDILRHLDAVIAEPYVEKLAPNGCAVRAIRPCICCRPLAGTGMPRRPGKRMACRSSQPETIFALSGFPTGATWSGCRSNSPDRA